MNGLILQRLYSIKSNAKYIISLSIISFILCIVFKNIKMSGFIWIILFIYAMSNKPNSIIYAISPLSRKNIVNFTYIIDIALILLIELFLISMYYLMLNIGLVNPVPDISLYFIDSFFTALFWIGFINIVTFSADNNGCFVIIIYLAFMLCNTLKNIDFYILIAIKLLILYIAYIISTNLAQKREY